MSRVRGELGAPGPAGMWFRLRVPIVAGEETTPFQRVAAVADFGNGVAAAIDRTRYSFINADLTITLHRLPAGEWVGLDWAMFPERTGIGVAESVLHDERGRIGRGVQTVLIEELTWPTRAPGTPGALPRRSGTGDPRLATTGVRALAVVGLVAPGAQLALAGLLAHGYPSGEVAERSGATPARAIGSPPDARR